MIQEIEQKIRKTRSAINACGYGVCMFSIVNVLQIFFEFTINKDSFLKSMFENVEFIEEYLSLYITIFIILIGLIFTINLSLGFAAIKASRTGKPRGIIYILLCIAVIIENFYGIYDEICNLISPDKVIEIADVITDISTILIFTELAISNIKLRYYNKKYKEIQTVQNKN